MLATAFAFAPVVMALGLALVSIVPALFDMVWVVNEHGPNGQAQCQKNQYNQGQNEHVPGGAHLVPSIDQEVSKS
jgi:hypothetical protein